MYDKNMNADLVLHPAVVDVIGPNYRLVDVARALGRSVQGMRALAHSGEFPRLFRVSRNDWRVERVALERWAETRWEDGIMVARRAEAVRMTIRQPAAARRRRGREP